ncbi:hypothetical protein C2E23DRAFT_840844 [Lenzites betulinus]|nr:hypothetical protein C2E23DRAFT_840844 [Lenzites betulinus]
MAFAGAPPTSPLIFARLCGTRRVLVLALVLALVGKLSRALLRAPQYSGACSGIRPRRAHLRTRHLCRNTRRAPPCLFRRPFLSREVRFVAAWIACTRIPISKRTLLTRAAEIWTAGTLLREAKNPAIVMPPDGTREARVETRWSRGPAEDTTRSKYRRAVLSAMLSRGPECSLDIQPLSVAISGSDILGRRIPSPWDRRRPLLASVGP